VHREMENQFLAEITIFPLGPDTRQANAFNGIRWAFSYANDDDANGREPETSDVWPEFLDQAGNALPSDVPLQGTIPARMHIVFPNMVGVHFNRLRVGTRFFCMEGSRKVASGIVTSLSAN
jgi:hypothetical protein